MTLSIVEIVLIVLIAASALVTIQAKLSANQRREYRFKPLTTGLVIVLALIATDPVSTRYHLLILAGLAAALAGDVLLMLPDRFLPGLVAFLVAHVFYIAAFTVEGRGTAAMWYGLPFLIYGVLLMALLWRDVGSLRIPVLVYAAAILLMGWQAANRWIEFETTKTLLAMLGAYLFIASDSTLAVERFRGGWRSAPVWVLSTYWAAQTLIALSI